MKRQLAFEEISDGKRYSADDMVRADCAGCVGCDACCHGMGESIVLDPYDIWRLYRAGEGSFQELLQRSVSLQVVDSVILPYLKMADKDACYYLDNNGRCRIHAARPGICRMFPLGRIYENGGMAYFLQIHECKKENRSKIKVKKWIATPDYKAYEKYMTDWHYFLEELEGKALCDEGRRQKEISMYLLTNFYLTPFDTEDFYGAFYERLEKAKKELQ